MTMKKMNLTTMIVFFCLVIANGAPAQEVSKGKQLVNMLTNKEDPDKVIMLAKNIDSANWRDNKGVSLLAYASFFGYKNVCKVLLDKGAKVDLMYTDGSTALMSATGNHHAGVIKLLLDHGANTNVQDTTGNTALISASCNGDTEIV
jgi:hypothetical protein